MGLTKQQKVMVAVLMSGAFMVVFNQTLLTPALPTIMSHLDVNATTVQWLTSGYALVEAVIIPLNAYFIGRFSTRRLFIGGTVLFAVGSAVCALAPTFEILFVGRIIQACATGVVMPMVFSMVLVIFPRESRGVAMGFVGLIVSFAPAIGPSISGLMIDYIGWRSLFVLVVMCACCIALLSIVSLKPLEGFDKTTFDGLSVVILSVGMVSLLYGISTSTSSTNVIIPALLIVGGLIVLAFFCRRQLKLDNPILRVQVLRHRELMVGIIIILVLQGMLIGGSVLFPLYIQNALGASATISGLTMLPGALLGACFSFLSGVLFDKYGVRKVSVPGGLILFIGGIGYVFLGETTPLVLAAVVYTLVCLGVQALITPICTWGMNSLPNASIPHGNAILSTVEQVGASLGTAFVVSLSALSGLIAPPDASAQAQSFAGCHIAFMGILLLMAIVLVLIMLFVREQKKPLESSLTPGVDRPWFVSDVMNSEPVTVLSSSKIQDALKLMTQHETSGLVIIDSDNRVVGFISDGDILKHLSRHISSKDEGDKYMVVLESNSMAQRIDEVCDLPVMQLATKRVISVNAGDNADVAFRVLADQRIKKAPVISDGKLVGTLSRHNIINALEVMREIQVP